jgi:Methylamine utilization protein MauJ
VRYEVAVVTNLAFHTQGHYAPAINDLPQPETVVIEFEGRRFVWHAVPPLELDPASETGLLPRARRVLGRALGSAARRLETVHRQERGPTVTTPITEMDDYEAERLAMARFLSAVAYETRQGVDVQAGGGAGVPAEFDPPVATGLRRFGDHIHEAPAEVVVVDDDRLRLVLGYYREGLGTESPYFKFLAFWNALDVACEDVAGRMETWIPQTLKAFPGLGRVDPPPADWWDRLENERRHAVAHAVRDPGRSGGVPDLDPDDPDVRSSFYNDARMLDDLVRLRVRERWGERAVYFRRRRIA